MCKHNDRRTRGKHSKGDGYAYIPVNVEVTFVECLRAALSDAFFVQTGLLRNCVTRISCAAQKDL